MSDAEEISAVHRVRACGPRVLAWCAVGAGILTLGWGTSAGAAPKSQSTAVNQGTATKATTAKATTAKTIGACAVIAHPDAARYTQCAGLVLTGAALAKVDLSYARFTGANLTGANLTGANLTGANLTGANLADAQLSGITWSATVCPDGTNSDIVSGTCVGHLSMTPAVLPPPAPVGPAYSLAFTGFDPWPFVAAGSGMIAVGMLFVGVARRAGHGSWGRRRLDIHS